jgi:hypothetical protein
MVARCLTLTVPSSYFQVLLVRRVRGQLSKKCAQRSRAIVPDLAPTEVRACAKRATPPRISRMPSVVLTCPMPDAVSFFTSAASTSLHEAMIAPISLQSNALPVAGAAAAFFPNGIRVTWPCAGKPKMTPLMDCQYCSTVSAIYTA